MHSSGLEFSNARDSLVRLGASHGYRIDGDLVALNAELAIASDEERAPDDAGSGMDREWALQLWACETPYRGGSLAGIKVAEAKLALPPSAESCRRLDAATPARLPTGQRDYSMVLVLASGQAGEFDQVHDFANYPARERFSVPHFDGAVGYRIEADALVVSVERVRNPRSEDNLTGSLLLELWALDDVYSGGPVQGERLAGTQLSRIAGQSTLEHVEYRMQFSQPPSGLSHLVLMLREWTATGYDTRDFCNFAAPHQRPDESPVPPVPSQAQLPAEPAQSLESSSPPEQAAREEATPPVALAVAAPLAVSIQHASLEELVGVKGLNKRLAVEIIKARPFTSLDQLIKVRGIGDKLLRKLRDHLTL